MVITWSRAVGGGILLCSLFFAVSVYNALAGCDPIVCNEIWCQGHITTPFGKVCEAWYTTDQGTIRTKNCYFCNPGLASPTYCDTADLDTSKICCTDSGGWQFGCNCSMGCELIDDSFKWEEATCESPTGTGTQVTIWKCKTPTSLGLCPP